MRSWRAVWPDVFVTDNSITQCVRDIRRALGDEAQRLLRTVPRRGYLFAAEVSRTGSAGPAAEEPSPVEKTSSQAPPAPEPSEPKGPSISSGAERRQLTVLFCDLVGSSALSERLDPEDFSEVIRSYQERCTAIVVSFGGHVAKYLGDGVLAYFGYPHAHEDAAEQSVRAGLAIIRAIDNLGACPDLTLHVRVGIATGLVVSGPAGEGGQGETAVGRPLNLAARLQEIAEPGAVVVADDTRRLLGEVFALRELGAVGLKGFAHPAHAFEVLAERPSGSRFEARQRGELLPMIGGDWELALVLERWRHAAAGEGQAVLLVGEAGIGKSRLVRATLDTIAGSEHTTLRYQCSPHHTGTPLWPVAQQLGLAAGLEPADGGTTKLDKLEVLLRQGVEDVSEAAPLIAALLGVEAGNRYPAPDLSPQRRRLRTLVVLVEQLLGLARRRPVLLVLEDAHWADPTTLELLGQALERIADARALMLLTSRPENQPSLGGHSLVTRLTLNRLGRGPTEAIVARLAGGRTLPPGVLGEITARTDGVPLFVEELTKAVLEAGAAGTGAAVVPASLHASLMARLDRVPGIKEVAQAAACIGREFAYPLLAAVSPVPEAELRDALERLVAAELVFRRGEPPEASYAFKHALVRDAAYESLLKSRRRQLHTHVAKALEEGFPEILAAEPEVVARHYTATELAVEAVPYWLRAGQQALQRSALREAIAQLTQGLGLLTGLPAGPDRDRKEADLRLALGNAIGAAQGGSAPEALQAYARVAELCERSGDTSHLVAALYGLITFHFSRADLASALGLAERALAAADRGNDVYAQLAGHSVVGLISLALGRLHSARAHLEHASALLDPARRRPLLEIYGIDLRVRSLVYLSWTLFALGYPSRARDLSRLAIVEAKDVSHPLTLGMTLDRTTSVAEFCRDVATVAARAEALAALGREQGFLFYVTKGDFDRGWVMVEEGGITDGIALMRASLSSLEASHEEEFMPHSLGLLAVALAKGQEVPEALSVARDALARVGRTGERLFEADLHRLEGDLLVAFSQPDQAEGCFRRAVALAREQGARWWELRATTSLARLWAGQGKHREAYDLLAPVYGWFTEGFDTPDLQDARALLHELR